MQTRHRRLQAEVSANAEKAAPSQALKVCNSRKLQMALGVQSIMCGSWDKTKTAIRIERLVFMKNKVVLITGALTGIGRATALAFAQEGARIVISGRHDEEGQKLVGELGKLGAEAEFVRSDVRHE